MPHTRHGTWSIGRRITTDPPSEALCDPARPHAHTWVADPDSRTPVVTGPRTG